MAIFGPRQIHESEHLRYRESNESAALVMSDTDPRPPDDEIMCSHCYDHPATHEASYIGGPWYRAERCTIWVCDSPSCDPRSWQVVVD